LANLLFLPAGNKIKARARLESESREMMIEGVLAIVDGLNPKLIKDKLETYLDTDPAASPRPSRQRVA
jgi:chemotaxis protein MotA